MKKYLVLMFAMILPGVSHAGTSFVDQATSKIQGVEICKAAALDKLVSFDKQAVADTASFRLVELDARMLNPSHYAWYEMEVSVNGVQKTVRTLVQLNRLTGGCI